MEEQRKWPIDIQTSKLLDWLVDRRHCKLKWQNSALVIREKINNAIQDMPENEEIKQLLSGSYIHYFHCLRIVEILRRTEASTKNIFGGYSSQRMKDWQEVVCLYEKDNIYLAELSSLLVRNVNYEIPSLKKQISKCQQLQQEYSRKELDYINNAAALREKFFISCKQFGIMGNDVRQELLSLCNDLPSGLDGIAEGTRNLTNALELYEACVAFVCGSVSEPIAPLLKHVQLKGNTTVYEWRTGQTPLAIERPVSMENVETQQPTEPANTIDWGDDTMAGIDQSGGIDWGITVGESTEMNGEEQGADVIDWGENASATVEIDVMESEAEGDDGVAKGNDALTILENTETRNQFVNELMELQTFLSQRLTEMNEEADILSINQFQTAPAIVQSQDVAKVVAMMTVVRDLVQRLTNVKMRHLFMIHASPRYIDRVTELLQQKLKQADAVGEKQHLMVKKQQQSLEEQAALEPKLDLLIQRTKELRKLIEADISKRYQNRRVNLMGVIV
ncbi:CDK5 regulatory subunit-associated protein 3 isoform X1 [Carcharodon carcharias]|uniref:CDK5 regulatory subunit-associated protein 3 isoform X1 n=2 Tax=Carcharodon carcharias TaxID=13397 RepID=UPI001B7EAC67|nr:CDK5 regulatory subunit-associated protein 3 isoform X1 [Carcharodon carcharias]